MASFIPLEPAERSTSDLTLLPRDPWPNQLQYLLLVFQAKQALERVEKAFILN
ncbi:hypothetical protein [Pseudanabaena sp. PCC 6802]|uniref:hypothetical protein n=1 Tax=Pseudanabaena sp. PCC 6802 TaxID=118173 RepID=UPI00034BF5B2|nr:hypothetical protein [Pseudanabaena sp. PCC 6802]